MVLKFDAHEIDDNYVTVTITTVYTDEDGKHSENKSLHFLTSDKSYLTFYAYFFRVLFLSVYLTEKP
jgi:hypothetical protein